MRHITSRIKVTESLFSAEKKKTFHCLESSRTAHSPKKKKGRFTQLLAQTRFNSSNAMMSIECFGPVSHISVSDCVCTREIAHFLWIFHIAIHSYFFCAGKWEEENKKRTKCRSLFGKNEYFSQIRTFSIAVAHIHANNFHNINETADRKIQKNVQTL